MIRDATGDDAEAIADIYNHAVTNTTAIWNDRTVDAPDRACWIADRQAAGFPVLVAEQGGQVAAYGSFGPWRAFDGYRLTVEHSVYVHPDLHRQGLGRIMLEALIDRARAARLHAMIAGIEAGNAPSIALHERLGFRTVGVMPQVGCKFGRWLDLAMMQLTLDDRPSPLDIRG